MKKKTERQKLIDDCDTQFSYLIRGQQQRCEYCGKSGTLHKDTGLFIKGLDCSHTIGRGNLRLRYDPRNCRSLCSYCHKYRWHSDSAPEVKAIVDWFIKKWPEDWQYLNEVKHQPHRMTISDFYDLLESLKTQVEALKAHKPLSDLPEVSNWTSD